MQSSSCFGFCDNSSVSDDSDVDWIVDRYHDVSFMEPSTSSSSMNAEEERREKQRQQEQQRRQQQRKRNRGPTTSTLSLKPPRQKRNVENDPNSKDWKHDPMTALIAKEMNEMSIEERTSATEDLHGIVEGRGESSSLAAAQAATTAKLSSLNINVNMNHAPAGQQGGGDIANDENTMHVDNPENNLDMLIGQVFQCINKFRLKTAFDKAMFLCPSFVTDPKFVLMFLRAKEFDIKDTATLIVEHFKYKLELWGLSKLVKRITLQDLSPGELEGLQAGGNYILTSKDTAGRTVIFIVHEYLHVKKPPDVMNQVRIMWYMAMSNLEHDEETQKKGFIVVRYHVGAPSLPTNELGLHLQIQGKAVFVESCPLQVKGFHFCYDNPTLKPLLNTIQLVIGKHHRARFRAHYGSNLECCYALMQFGIPKNALPFQDMMNGNLKGGLYDEYIARQTQLEYLDAKRQREANIPPEGKILYPNIHDVLLGRGRPQQEYPGNVQLASIVDVCREAYKSASKEGKTRKATEIVAMIKGYGGRFLKKEDTNDKSFSSSQSGYWVEVVDDRTAREKVSHTFRRAAKPTKRFAKETTTKPTPMDIPLVSTPPITGTTTATTTTNAATSAATSRNINTVGAGAPGLNSSSNNNNNNNTGAVPISAVVAALSASAAARQGQSNTTTTTIFSEEETSPGDVPGPPMNIGPTSWLMNQYTNWMGGNNDALEQQQLTPPTPKKKKPRRVS